MLGFWLFFNSAHSGHGNSGAHGTSFNIAQPFTMLFESWKIETDGDLAWTCIVLGIVCILYEAIKGGKRFLDSKINEAMSWYGQIYAENF